MKWQKLPYEDSKRYFYSFAVTPHLDIDVMPIGEGVAKSNARWFALLSDEIEIVRSKKTFKSVEDAKADGVALAKRYLKGALERLK